MIDRFGKTIKVDWSAHEELWVEAALSLPRIERTDALWDIAQMTGRGIHAVRAKAEKIASQKRLEAAERTMITRSVMVPARDLRRYLKAA